MIQKVQGEWEKKGCMKEWERKKKRHMEKVGVKEENDVQRKWEREKKKICREREIERIKNIFKVKTIKTKERMYGEIERKGSIANVRKEEKNDKQRKWERK